MSGARVDRMNKTDTTAPFKRHTVHKYSVGQGAEGKPDNPKG